MQDKGQKLFKGCLLFLCVTTALIMLFYPLVARRYLNPAKERDRLEAPQQKGTAQVVVYVPARDEEVTNKHFPLRIMVRFQGQVLEPREVVDGQHIKPDSTVEILYRIGKSGRLYIDVARPLASP